MEKVISEDLAIQTWRQLEAIYLAMNDTIKKEVGFDLTSKNRFCNYFKRIYEKLSEQIKHENKALSRHKIAAIIVATIIKIKPLTDKKGLSNENSIFISNEVIALVFALEYIKIQVNQILQKSNSTETIQNLYITKPINKNTNEFDILVKNLYIESTERGGNISVNTWAYLFYLIEIQTLYELEIVLPKEESDNY